MVGWVGVENEIKTNSAFSWVVVGVEAELGNKYAQQGKNETNKKRKTYFHAFSRGLDTTRDRKRLNESEPSNAR